MSFRVQNYGFKRLLAPLILKTIIAAPVIAAAKIFKIMNGAMPAICMTARANGRSHG